MDFESRYIRTHSEEKSFKISNIIFTIFLIKNTYRLITVYLLLWVNCDKIMHAHWDFNASRAQTWKVSALDKHQNWSASALFCHNSQA